MIIRSGKLTAVMNGQTGRIAVSKDRKKVFRGRKHRKEWKEADPAQAYP